MARFARVTDLGTPHLIAQRGRAPRPLFETDTERTVYLDLLQQNTERFAVKVLGYCVTPNDVRLIAIPLTKDALARCLRGSQSRFAAYWNHIHQSSGPVWQERNSSRPLDEGHLWQALRELELTPVRASLIARACDWPCSSAAAHCGVVSAANFLHMETWSQRWSTAGWTAYLQAGSREPSTTVHGRTPQWKPAGLYLNRK